MNYTSIEQEIARMQKAIKKIEREYLRYKQIIRIRPARRMVSDINLLMPARSGLRIRESHPP